MITSDKMLIEYMASQFAKNAKTYKPGSEHRLRALKILESTECKNWLNLTDNRLTKQDSKFIKDIILYHDKNIKYITPCGKNYLVTDSEWLHKVYYWSVERVGVIKQCGTLIRY